MPNYDFISRDEIFLFNIGEWYHSYRKFGAHILRQNGRAGTHFAVWVPEVNRVSVVGDFNNWQPASNPLREVGDTGIWTGFVPENLNGRIYKYWIETKDYEVFFKADPYAFYAERRPATASVVYSLAGYEWQDQDWMRKRQQGDPRQKPISIYEVHAASWRRQEDGGLDNWRRLAGELVEYAASLGYTHIELLPVAEHPYDGSWGYQITGYYACTSRYGTPHDFMYFIDCCHRAGLGVILDWVPGHFCKDAHGLGRMNGQSVYEKGEHEHWGTYKFDLGKTEVLSFLISNALFWLDKYHIDGLRVDGVSSMLYLDYEKGEFSRQHNIYGGRENLEAISFLQKLNEVIHQYYPGVLSIAEEATDFPLITYPPYQRGLGFNYKWNMGWMNDILKYMQLDFSLRSGHHHLLTFSLIYAFSENFVLPLSHDEVVHGKHSLLNKMPGNYAQKFAGLRAMYGFFLCHPGKKLMFMGGELAQFIEWRFDAELDWLLLGYEMHRKHQNYVREFNNLYRRERALWEIDHDWEGFEWIDVHNNEQSIIVFCRRGKQPGDLLVALFNFLPCAYDNFRIGVPQAGVYREIMNSDQEAFGGLNLINTGQLVAVKEPWHGREYSLALKVPPLAAIILKPVAQY